MLPRPRALVVQAWLSFADGLGTRRRCRNVPLNFDPERRPCSSLSFFSIGADLPISSVNLRVGNESGRDIKPDDKTIGEVVLKSNVVMAGYLGNPEATAETFGEQGWFHAGHMAAIEEEGCIQMADRKKDIISGGEKTSSLQVERLLYSDPGVLEPVVIAVPHEFWGEVPKAIVCLKGRETAPQEGIIEHCRECLARYKDPKVVEFVEELPKGGTGKTVKNILKQRYCDESNPT
jgi:fatty-acyl-CoA synthase